MLDTGEFAEVPPGHGAVLRNCLPSTQSAGGAVAILAVTSLWTAGLQIAEAPIS